LTAGIAAVRSEYAPKIQAARKEARQVGREKRKPVSPDKPDKLEPKPFVGTISEMAEMLAKSVESWDPVEKVVFRAGVTGKLSADVSERIQ